MTEVIIKTLDQNNQEIKGKGYICKKISENLYEVWSEELNSILILNKDQFVNSETDK